MSINLRIRVLQLPLSKEKEQTTIIIYVPAYVPYHPTDQDPPEPAARHAHRLYRAAAALVRLEPDARGRGGDDAAGLLHRGVAEDLADAVLRRLRAGGTGGLRALRHRHHHQ